MTAHLALVVARMHGVLVHRPGSGVFHVASSDDLTPSGRYLRRAARTSCSARTRRLSVISRIGVTVDLGGRRMCARCSARLSAVARRAEQPVTRTQSVAFYTGITMGDLAVAVALAGSVDETHRIGYVATILHGPMTPSTTRRPVELSHRQARYDLEVEILRLRRSLAAAERTPEEVEAVARKREADAQRDARALAGRTTAARLNRAIDRRNQGQYLMPHERELLSSA